MSGEDQDRWIGTKQQTMKTQQGRTFACLPIVVGEVSCVFGSYEGERFPGGDMENENRNGARSHELEGSSKLALLLFCRVLTALR